MTFRPLAPDAPAVAETGRWDPALTPGLLVNDIDCRLDAMQRRPAAPQPRRLGVHARAHPRRGQEDPVEPDDDADR